MQPEVIDSDIERRLSLHNEASDARGYSVGLCNTFRNLCKRVAALLLKKHDFDSRVPDVSIVPPLRSSPSTFYRRQTGRPWAGLQTQADKFLPSALGVVGIGEKLQICAIHGAFLNQQLKVYDA